MIKSGQIPWCTDLSPSGSCVCGHDKVLFCKQSHGPPTEDFLTEKVNVQVTSQQSLLKAAKAELEGLLTCPDHSRNSMKLAFRRELADKWLVDIESDGQEAWKRLQHPFALKSLETLYRVYIRKIQSNLWFMFLSITTERKQAKTLHLVQDYKIKDHHRCGMIYQANNACANSARAFCITCKQQEESKQMFNLSLSSACGKSLKPCTRSIQCKHALETLFGSIYQGQLDSAQPTHILRGIKKTDWTVCLSGLY